MLGCGKIGYATRNEAAHYLKQIQSTKFGRGGLRPYRCKTCGLWHHGRKAKNKRG